MPADVSDSFLLATTLPDLGRPDPAIPMIFSTEAAGESRLAIDARTTEKQEQRKNIRSLPLGVFGSLALHLLPLLMLVSWGTVPTDPPETIPVQLVMVPSVPSPVADQPPPRRGSASDDMGPKLDRTAKTASSSDPEPQPELKTALAAPESPPEPLPRPDAVLEPPPPPPPPKPKQPSKSVAHQPDAVLRLAGPSGWKVLGERPATRDDYLALLKALTQRHMNLLPPSLIAGRRGDTYLTVLVLGDGTIARIAITRSSGYPDIDERVEQMVAAVGRFPPIPARFGDSSMELIMHLRFPEGTER
ncbi:MAG: TonB C-terminal domain-containing protein [Alphaproteobacteria bacterium]|nr:TonB C-terminal domain-containing protein [Alphaproteobacteria bacterium]